jgi:hypothetical protein
MASEMLRCGGYPQMTQIIHIKIGFSIKKHPFLGIPHLWKPPNEEFNNFSQVTRV